METKREPKLGSEKCGPEFGPDKRCEEEDTSKEVKRSRMALSFRWIDDNNKRS